MAGRVSLIPVDDLRREILAAVRPLPPRSVSIDAAAGLVLANDVVTLMDLPPFDNAAMDGFALRAADTVTSPATFGIVGHAFAGRPWHGRIGPGEAVTIATGAPIPAGADAVVPFEEATVDGQTVVVGAPVRPGRHVRRRGEDAAAGTMLVAKGKQLGPGQLAAVAGAGSGQVFVHPRPRVAILPTGDEVAGSGAQRGDAQVYDAVSVPLAALLREAGALPAPLPPVPDDVEALRSAVRRAAAAADAVVTIGGVSTGHRDLLVRAFEEIRAYRVALRPAKPFAFGCVDRTPLFGLPGNPAAALASFEELVRPAVLAMLGRPPRVRAAIRASLAEPFSQRSGSLHLVRVQVWREGDRLMARPSGHQGAGMLHSLARADGWMAVPAEAADLDAGAEVDVRLWLDPP